MIDVIEQIDLHRHITLITFRRDGRTVPTPLWFAVDDGELLLLTESNSGKVKRIRNNSQVLIAPCDDTGHIPEGTPTMPAAARLLDEAGTRRAHHLISLRYIAEQSDRLRRRDRQWIGIAVTLY
ncbi:PPOX class F420-dependent oxidoreductase [Nocardia sp. NPDC051030]|uniref:PPOX class F420-dependent oxidoreductase n=1 Tax=Nocardia sp. NPDC051030 TaxID=3155162 RepID=UPI0034125AC7